MIRHCLFCAWVHKWSSLREECLLSCPKDRGSCKEHLGSQLFGAAYSPCLRDGIIRHALRKCWIVLNLGVGGMLRLPNESLDEVRALSGGAGYLFKWRTGYHGPLLVAPPGKATIH